MKRFILKWGKGSVLGINTVYKTMEVEAENIDDIDCTVILPDIIKKKIYYVRTIITSQTKRNYDYGSWVDFIEAVEIDYQKKD